MSWAAPPTFVSGAALTAAQLNVLAGDLNETAPAKFTAAGQYFAANGANIGTARTPLQNIIDTGETTTTVATYGNLATIGARVSPPASATALVGFGCMANNNTTNTGSLCGYEIVTGGTTYGAPWTEGLRIGTESTTASGSQYTAFRMNYEAGLSNSSGTVFTLKYTTATGGTSTFSGRTLLVLPM